MDITSDFQAYHVRVTKSLIEVVRAGGQISNTDLSFHRSSDKISRQLDQQNARLLRLTNKLLKAACQDSVVKPPALRDQDAVDDSWRGIVSVVDDLLEKSDICLDEFTGAIRRMSPVPQEGVQTPPKQPAPSTKLGYSRMPNQFPKVMYKPQMHFQRKVNNINPEPFKPLLVEKPHAIKPSEESIGNGPEQYGHPYAEEISQYNYPPRVYETAPPIPPTPPEQSSAVMVDTERAVQDMLVELKTAREIAIDLEHHEYRSYYGIVSLMQISTRNKDWIVDTLTPWRHKLQALNEVFADPSIVKVFHGSSMDMIWLQRDLGLYVVGLFDTYYACEALQFPGRGLKYLLLRFVNFEAQKQYQMADWRIRPLPFELIDYARSDTHYLLYIYDCVRNMLIEQSTPQANLINHVLIGSKSEAAQIYTRFTYNKESGRGSHGWYNLFTEHSNRFTTKQFAVFRALHEWRDKKAREEDEGLPFIFSNKLLWVLAENMPTTQTALWSIKPLPQAVSLHSSEFLSVVQQAIQEAESDPMPHEFLRQNEDKYGIPHNRWRKAKEEKPKTQLSGVGATLQQLTQNGEVGSAVNASTTLGPPVADRAQQSTLWGKITNAMSDVSIETAAASAALQTILPLPNLSNESFDEVNGIHSPTTSIEMPSAAPTSPQQPTPSKVIVDEVNEPFTLKQQSRKRKVEEIEISDNDGEAFTTPAGSSRATATTNGDTSPTSPDAMETRNGNPKHDAKRLAKQKKKAEKKVRKAATEAEAAAQAANMVPFDYASAENLIDLTNDPRERSLPDDRSPRNNNSKKAKKDGKNKPMNPFAKALDTSTGVRKKMGNAKELGGRSMTFQA